MLPNKIQYIYVYYIGIGIDDKDLYWFLLVEPKLELDQVPDHSEFYRLPNHQDEGRTILDQRDKYHDV